MSLRHVLVLISICTGHSWKLCFEHDLSVYDTLNNTVICWDYIASNCEMVTEYWIWKDVEGRSKAWYQTLYYHLLGRTGKNHINPHQPRHKPGTSQMQIGVVLTQLQDTVWTCCTTNWMWTHWHNWFWFRLLSWTSKSIFCINEHVHLHNSLS